MWQVVWLIGFLLTTLSNDSNARAHDIHDDDAPYTRPVTGLDTLDTGRTGLDFILSSHFNLTAPGKRRGTRRSLPRSLLEARQDTQGCTQPGFVLVCPITENAPCCDQSTPVCCHDPSDTCCPSGFFCSGLTTCCRDGAIGCGEGCCPGVGYACQIRNGASVCVESNGSTPVSNTPTGLTTSAGQGASGSATSTPYSAPNNTPIIAGAAGGGVGAILIIVIVAWWLLRKKTPKTPADPGPNTNPTPYASSPPPMAAVSPPYQGNTPSMHKTKPSWSATAPANGYPYNNPPYDMHSQNGSPPPPAHGQPYNNAPYDMHSQNGSPPPATTTRMMSMHEEAVGPGGYVPPPPEDAVSSTMSPGGSAYYTPQPALGAGPNPYFGVAPSHPASSAYGGPSRSDTVSPDSTTYSSTPWNPGTSQQNDGQTYPRTTGAISNQDQRQQDQQPVWAQPVSPPSRVSAISPPPIGPMSPPPPFAVEPPAFGGGNASSGSENTGGGRQVPMTAPADRKARPSGAGAPAR